MTGWFGTSWGAAVCDPDHQCAVPVGQPCHWCEELFTADDSGIVTPYIRSELEATFVFWHLECFMRSIVGSVGHQLGRCSCHGGTEDCEPPTKTKREWAKEAWELARTVRLTGREEAVAFLALDNDVALDRCAVCGKVIGFGVRALHLGRCEDHPERPS